MSQKGRFRTSMGGFNKQDVLRYLDELNRQEYVELEQTQAMLDQTRQELASVREQLVASEHRAAVAEEDTRTLQTAIDEYVQSAREKSDATEELISLRREKQMWRVKESSLTRLANQLQQEVASLRQQLAEKEDASALRRELETARENEEKSRALAETIGSLSAEMRRIEQENLRACCQKSEEGLQALYQLLEQWEAKAAAEKKEVAVLKNELTKQQAVANEMLETLSEKMECAAGGDLA